MNVQPFRIAVPDAEIDDLRRRLAEARWPGGSPGDASGASLTGGLTDDPSRGIPASVLRELAERWRTGYDWRAHEARLSALGSSVTEIDGQRIHLLHVRAADPDALPLLLTHGFPSSVAELDGLVDRLVHPEQGPAFHVVVPSLPGYGFSTPLAGPGWTVGRTAAAWAELMARLGYDRYGVHGGDVGAAVSGSVAALDPDHVVGLHVVTDPLTAANVATFLPGLADRLDPDDPVDRLVLDRMAAFRTDGSGYLAIQSSRPQTIGYGLADSPLLQLAWVAEKVLEWTDLPVDVDQLLTTVSLYWFTRSGASAAHTLYDQAHASGWGGAPQVPQGFSVFGADATVRRIVPAPPDAWWVEHERGGHFPAMEAPDVLAADLRAFFGPLR